MRGFFRVSELEPLGKRLLLLFIFIPLAGSFFAYSGTDIHNSGGIGPVARNFGSIYNNPCLLLLEESWGLSFVTSSFKRNDSSAAEMYGISLIQPAEDSFAGSIDGFFESFNKSGIESEFVSLGYSVAGSINNMLLGARFSGGRFDDSASSTFFGSVNFGVAYPIIEDTYLSVNYISPFINFGSESPVYFDNTENAKIGTGIFFAGTAGNAYISGYYSPDLLKPKILLSAGLGSKIENFGWDIALVSENSDFFQTWDKSEISARILLFLEYSDFSTGVEFYIPIKTIVPTESYFSIYVRSKW